MRIYIQSKSGDYNSAQEIEGIGTLTGALNRLRQVGGYTTVYHDKDVRVPFEEIEHIRKAGTNE